jgi:hypothetical protein
MRSTSIHLTFLTRDGCANTPELLANLEVAARKFNPNVQYELVNQRILAKTDARTGYPTPTILYNHRDLFGMPVPTRPFAAPS